MSRLRRGGVGTAGALDDSAEAAKEAEASNDAASFGLSLMCFRVVRLGQVCQISQRVSSVSECVCILIT